MMKRGIAVRRREAGMSEVVGFLMILGLIMTAASLYLTYGVPATGRENEIVHMTEISDQFLAFKLNMDSLYTNSMIGTTTSNAFSLGTSSAHVTGQMILLPIMNPVSSGGVMAINQRYVMPETLNLSSYSLVNDPSVRDVTNLPAGVATSVPNRPRNLYVNLTVSQTPSPTSPAYYWTDVSGSGWKARVNVTHRTSPYILRWGSSTCPTGTQLTGSQGGIGGNGTDYYCMYPQGKYDGTDISVTVIKSNTITLQNLLIFKDIAAGKVYTIDLMDATYGLDSGMTYPDTLTLANTGPTGYSGITGSGNATYGYRDMNYVAPLIPLGSVEYRSVNNYWINQNYYYQMGGVILQQTGTGSTFKHPPEIGFSYGNSPINQSQKLITVDIDALTIDQNDWDLVGGNSPVKLKSTLTNITMLPYATTTGANTRWIRIGFNTTDPEAGLLWKNYMNNTALTAGIPDTLYDAKIEHNESYILIKDNTTTPGNDINVRVSKATYSVKVHGVS